MPKYYLALKAMIAFSGAEGGQGSVLKVNDSTRCEGGIVLASYVATHRKLEHAFTQEWWWRKDDLREITEEQALDPNFRKFMYKIYSGDPDGELYEIL